jgi:lipoprotein Spr
MKKASTVLAAILFIAVTCVVMIAPTSAAFAEEQRPNELAYTVSGPDTSEFSINMDSLISYAKTLVGIPYKYGGQTLAGFDCSGFVNYIFKKVGLALPRSSSEMGNIGKEVSLAESRKGDIILFGGSDPKSRPIGHAGIIVSNPGEPVKFIHSQTSNHKGIVVSVLDGYDYFVKRFVKVVRIVEKED